MFDASHTDPGQRLTSLFVLCVQLHHLIHCEIGMFVRMVIRTIQIHQLILCLVTVSVCMIRCRAIWSDSAFVVMIVAADTMIIMTDSSHGNLVTDLT